MVARTASADPSTWRDLHARLEPRADLSPDELADLTEACWWLGDIGGYLGHAEELHERYVDADTDSPRSTAVELDELARAHHDPTLRCFAAAVPHRGRGMGPRARAGLRATAACTPRRTTRDGASARRAPAPRAPSVEGHGP